MERRLKIPGKMPISFKNVYSGAGKMILYEKTLTGKCDDLQSPHSEQRKATSESCLLTSKHAQTHRHTRTHNNNNNVMKIFK